MKPRSYRSAVLSQASVAEHGFFTAKGGVSEGMYASLNCGPGSDDHPEHVLENRRRVAETMRFEPESLCTLYQIHSATCQVVTESWAQSDAPQADAMVTNQPGLLLGILTADCAPILFADAKAGVAGAAHAGWKGALGGVLENTLEQMEALGADRTRIVAAIGPCIHRASYEVSEEFLIPFCEDDPENERFFIEAAKKRHPEESRRSVSEGGRREDLGQSSEISRRPNGLARNDGVKRYHFDLPSYLLSRAQKAGLQRIESLAIDTYPEENHCFSNRRRTHKGESDYGRQISVIGLKE